MNRFLSHRRAEAQVYRSRSLRQGCSRRTRIRTIKIHYHLRVSKDRSAHLRVANWASGVVATSDKPQHVDGSDNYGDNNRNCGEAAAGNSNYVSAGKSFAVIVVGLRDGGCW
jgi:hypothetical protein